MPLHPGLDRRTQGYAWFLRLACLLFLCISLTEVPDFRALDRATDQRGSKHWRFFAEHKLVRPQTQSRHSPIRD